MIRHKRSFYFFLFSVMTIHQVSAYIDPATGSMLFSALIGIFATVYFLLKQIVMKFKFFTPSRSRHKKDSHSIVLYSEGPQYWNVFRPLLDELTARGEPCAYLTAHPDDPGLSYASDLVEKRFIGTGNKAYMRLNLLEADVCVATTPGLDVLQFKRSKRVNHYCHILHHLNNTSTYRLFGIDYYDSILLNGPHQTGIIRELERKRKTPAKDLVITGSTYMDCMLEKKALLPEKQEVDFTVLVSPSWGPNGLLNRYGMKLLKPLAESGMNLILRPHPQSSLSEKEMLEQLKDELAGYDNIEWDFNKENINAMDRSDMMISDFSSIMFDYVFLFARPVAVFNFSLDPRGFDLSDITEENAYYMIKDSGAILHFDAENFDEIPAQIRELTVQPDLQSKINALRDYAWEHPGEAGKRAVDFILQKRNQCIS